MLLQKVLHCKFVPGTLGRFSGLASTWQPDRDGDAIVPGAFKKTIAAWSSRAARIPVLVGHNPDRLIGAIVTAVETGEGLEVEGQLVANNVLAEEAMRTLEVGGYGMSIGFFLPPNTTRHRADGVRLLMEIDLVEISLVPVPSNSGAVVRDVKGNIRVFEAAARDALGLTSREAKRLCAGGFHAMVRDAPHEPDDKALAVSAALQRIINSR